MSEWNRLLNELAELREETKNSEIKLGTLKMKMLNLKKKCMISK